jgi:hypothetical protein
MSFDKNEKDCINGIPLIEIQENQNYFYFYTGLLLKSKANGRKKGSRTTGINYFIDDLRG